MRRHAFVRLCPVLRASFKWWCGETSWRGVCFSCVRGCCCCCCCFFFFFIFYFWCPFFDSASSALQPLSTYHIFRACGLLQRFVEAGRTTNATHAQISASLFCYTCMHASMQLSGVDGAAASRRACVLVAQKSSGFDVVATRSLPGVSCRCPMLSTAA